MTRATTAMLCAVLALMSACGGQAPTAAAPGSQGSQASQPQAASVPPVAAPAGDGTVIAHVEVKGGPQAGTYDAKGKKADCGMSARGSGATYADVTKADGLSALLFASSEAGGSPTKFYFQALFGAVGLAQPSLEIMTLDPSTTSGRGTAQLADKGTTIKWTIDGTTKDGVAVKATIECGPVDR